MLDYRCVLSHPVAQDPTQSFVHSGYKFYQLSCISKTGFLYVALAILKLTVKIRTLAAWPGNLRVAKGDILNSSYLSGTGTTSTHITTYQFSYNYYYFSFSFFLDGGLSVALADSDFLGSSNSPASASWVARDRPPHLTGGPVEVSLWLNSLYPKFQFSFNHIMAVGAEARHRTSASSPLGWGWG